MQATESLDRRWTLSETSYSVAGPSLGAEHRTRLCRSSAQLFAVCALDCTTLTHNIPDPISHGEESARVEGLREEVGEVVRRGDEGHRDLMLLDKLANVVVTTLDVLRPLVVLRVVSDVDRRLVVDVHVNRRAVVSAEFLAQFRSVDRFFGALGGSHELGLTRGQSYAGLLLGRPRDGRLGQRPRWP